MRVLLALEDSDRASAVLAWARRLRAELAHAPELVGLHVVPVLAAGTTGVLDVFAAEDLADAVTRLREQARAVVPDLQVRAGSPGQVICEEARGFDLVVIGGGSRSQLGELILGSTSAFVSHHAPCAVLLVPLRPEASGR